ncbi:MAG: hypothetical protein AAGA56_27745 [Myxococcota bacterium]
MNSELRAMMGAAEGRYLTGEEAAAVRTWAVGMNDRLETVERLAEKESQIVSNAVAAVQAKHPNEANDALLTQAKLEEMLKQHFRYVAQAYVLDDTRYFEEQYAQWTAELLTSMGNPAAMVDVYRLAKEAAESTLDPADMRAFRPYVEIFQKALESH